MELQAIRYAAMVSTMTFDRVIDIYQRYLAREGSNLDARTNILDFLGWEEPNEDSFAQDVKIVLVSSNFSKELTTAVMWLNKRDLDIRCIRLVPYQDGGRIFIDVQQVIPLPEAAEYQIQIREKEQKERKERVERYPFRKFWETLLGLGEGKTPLHSKMQPSTRSHIGANTGIDGVRYIYILFQHTCRVEIYIECYDAILNKKIFDGFYSHKEEIEESFGGPLLWQRLDEKRGSRFGYDMTIGGYKDDESNWEAIQMAMIDAMIRFEKATSPFIPGLIDLK